MPYLGFLYFLGYEANRTPKMSQFGFSFLLLFVVSTVATGIVSKSVYGALWNFWRGAWGISCSHDVAIHDSGSSQASLLLWPGCSLADVDWLHGAAEALLTTSNLYVAFGFRNALAGDAEPQVAAITAIESPPSPPLTSPCNLSPLCCPPILVFPPERLHLDEAAAKQAAASEAWLWL